MNGLRQFWLLTMITILAAFLPFAARADQSQGYFSVSVHVIPQCNMTINVPNSQNPANVEGTIGMNCTRGTSFTVRVTPVGSSSTPERQANYTGVGTGNVQTIAVAYRIPEQVTNTQDLNSHAIQLVINY